MSICPVGCPRCAMAEGGGDVAIPLKRSARDPERVRAVMASWLAPRVGARGAVSVSPLDAPPGGVANETLLFDATWIDDLGRERTDGFVVRLATPLPLFIESDIELHARCYQALEEVPGVPVPHVYGYEPDEALLGARFFVMERIDGSVPRDFPSWTQEGFLAEADLGRRRTTWESAVDVLVSLHRLEVSRFPFLAPAAGQSGLAANLAYWRRFLDHGEAGSPFDPLERAYEWLVAHAPEPQPTGFAWGDARFCNLVFRDDRVVAVLDWDQVSLAGPETDLAWWRIIDPGAHGALPGVGDGEELVRRWEEGAGRSVRAMGWHDLYAQFRMGVVMLNLFRNMGLSCQLPPDVAERQGREGNAVAHALAERLQALD